MKILILISFMLSVDRLHAQTVADKILDSIKNKTQQLSQEGLKLLEEKCNTLDSGEYCFLVARYYEQKKDFDKSIIFFGKSCQKKFAYGCLLGGYLLERQGFEEKSNGYYTMGCELAKNGGENCLALGQNAREMRNWSKALEFYEKACDKEEYMGCYLAGEMAMFAGIRDMAYRAKKYRKGCQLGHPGSCWYLGEVQKYRGFHDEAKEAYQKACVGEIYEACEEFKNLNKGGLKKDFEQKITPKINSFKDKMFFWFEKLFPLK